MKKTHSINLGGQVFHIDEDAYRLFENYLARCNRELKQEANALKSWEQKLAERASEKLSSSQQVIDMDLALEILHALGYPHSSYTEPEPNEADSSASARAGESKNHRYYAEQDTRYSYRQGEKRFYRDTDNGMICGVCSGIAAYTGWHLTAVRVLFVLLAITINVGFWWLVIGYLLAWLIVPPAVTASQKLEMYGKPITDETLGEQLAADASLHQKPDAKLSSCLGCLFKGVLLVLVLGLILSLITGLISIGFGFFAGMNSELYKLINVHGVAPLLLKLTIVSLLILIVLPFLILDKASWLSRQLRLNSSIRWFLLLLWIASLIVVAVVFIWASSKMSLEFYAWLRDIVVKFRRPW